MSAKKNEKRPAFREDIVQELKNDFAKRQKQRRGYELQWLLNMNFLNGNQYCDVFRDGIVDLDKAFYWQQREVYNHIAPIVETRLAKLQRVKPRLVIRPFDDSKRSVYSANASEGVLQSYFEKLNMDSQIADANAWCETAGTVFYKIVWSPSKGRYLGDKDDKPVFEGEPAISVCPPFELYPDSDATEKVEDCRSIIHARAMATAEIFNKFGVNVEREEITDFYNGSPFNNGRAVEDDTPYAMVLEKFQKPSEDCPNGLHVIVAGDKLVHYSELPYINGDEQTRGYPFVKQEAVKVSGCFWGKSIIERLIPLQRAYNALKNRKYEYLNRLSIGVLAVEDGSVDVDSLEQEGLQPGKILTYRQGCTPPGYMSNAILPMPFFDEEERLKSEFVTISGVSDVMRSGTIPKVTSGSAISLLIEQDDYRMASTFEQARNAIVAVAKQLLRVVKQFACVPRNYRVVRNGNSVVFSLAGKDIESDDVVFETDNDLNSSLASRRELIMKMYALGMFNNSEGRIDESCRNKLLELMGLSGFTDNEKASNGSAKNGIEGNAFAQERKGDAKGASNLNTDDGIERKTASADANAASDENKKQQASIYGKDPKDPKAIKRRSL
ncbi:MAG: hypothetical protein PHX51_05050 [Clostridia bacterium]|nr:hypothetical protein [Clostridia bacterium]